MRPLVRLELWLHGPSVVTAALRYRPSRRRHHLDWRVSQSWKQELDGQTGSRIDTGFLKE